MLLHSVYELGGNLMYTIYKITNTINNKIYVGLTRQSIQKRLKQHLWDDRNNSAIHKGIVKYGIENFTIEPILDGISSVEEAGAWEVFLIDSFDSTNKNIGYNISKGGNVPPNHKGIKRSDEFKENCRQLLLGKPGIALGMKQSEEWVAKRMSSRKKTLESKKNV